MIKRIREDLKDQGGSSAVEFALVLMILVVLLFGIVEFGIILYDKAVVTNASREGARFGAVFSEPGSEITCGDITNVVRNYTTSHLITFGTGVATPTYPNGCNPGPGNNLIVRVAFRYDFLLLPNLPLGLPGFLNLVGQTTMVKEG